MPLAYCEYTKGKTYSEQVNLHIYYILPALKSQEFK